MARVKKSRAAPRKNKYGRIFMALAVVAGGAALWAGAGSRASRPPARQIVAARTVAPAAPASAAAPAPVRAPVAAPPKPAPQQVQEAPAPAPQQAQPAPQQAQAPIAVPLPRARTVEAAAEAMSTEVAAALDAWLVSAYKRCWKASTTPPEGEPYFPKIRVAFKTDGALAAPPRLVNPPSDPAWKPQADAALRAVKACDPLHVPDKYAPYYRQWKTKTVYFDPARS